MNSNLLEADFRKTSHPTTIKTGRDQLQQKTSRRVARCLRSKFCEVRAASSRVIMFPEELFSPILRKHQ